MICIYAHVYCNDINKYIVISLNVVDEARIDGLVRVYMTCTQGKDIGQIMSCSFMGFPLLSRMSAVVIKADFLAAGVQSGWAAFSRAPMLLRWGVDIEVPIFTLKTTLLGSSIPVGLKFDGQPATMFTPGPIMSGFRMPGLTMFGPLEVNADTIGAAVFSKTDPMNTTPAFGFLVEFK
ncbi:hypothetical protein AMTR_s00420p00013340 [Amborella trichopoda]|uniref:Uncharacterized protein n=1 Tax=Amborella trichopoda TaxID=13333 RepID=W1PQX6_AMBTC|nr:hypothetical protein AMTR_s00420p00013340 [Amborella trichopoda]